MLKRLNKITSTLKDGFTNLDAMSLADQIADQLPKAMPREAMRKKMIDVFMSVGIPFNRWLGLKIKEITVQTVVIESPPTTLRKNHVGTAHACAQALIGEYAAGLLIAQHFPVDLYRVIIGRLEVDYHKAGRGTLYGQAMAPGSWPDTNDDQAWIEMETRITDKAGDLVSICKTRWQVKTWEAVRKRKSAREKGTDL